MLFAGRVDYLMGYPIEAQYVAEKLGKRDELLFYPVAETEKKFTIGHVGCPDTEWGRQVIDNINRILRDYREDPAFVSFYENWLGDDTKQRYRELVKAF